MDANRRTALKVATLAAVAVLAVGGCATVRQVLALRQVQFDIERADGVRLAGVALAQVRSFSDLSLLDAGRIAAAIASGNVPLEFDLMIRGENPAENGVAARLVRMTWTLALNERETISGNIDSTYTFAPGTPTVFAVPISLDVYRFFRANARDAFELAKGLSGVSSTATRISVTAMPVVDTPLGEIRYPEPIVIVRRTVGGER